MTKDKTTKKELRAQLIYFSDRAIKVAMECGKLQTRLFKTEAAYREARAWARRLKRQLYSTSRLFDLLEGVLNSVGLECESLRVDNARQAEIILQYKAQEAEVILLRERLLTEAQIDMKTLAECKERFGKSTVPSISTERRSDHIWWHGSDQEACKTMGVKLPGDEWKFTTGTIWHAVTEPGNSYYSPELTYRRRK